MDEELDSDVEINDDEEESAVKDKFMTSTRLH